MLLKILNAMLRNVISCTIMLVACCCMMVAQATGNAANYLARLACKVSGEECNVR